MSNYTLDDLRAALKDGNVQAFLRAIRLGESDPDINDAYHALYGWSRRTATPRFDDLTTHPRQAFKSAWGWTSAAGAYQAMAAVPGRVTVDTWGDWVKWCAPQAFAPTFSYTDQDLFAVWGIARRKALSAVLSGRFDEAIGLCAHEWASLPGSPYGQPTVSLESLREAYVRYGGTFDGEPKPAPATQESTPLKQTQETRMAPLIAALLPSIVQAIPALAKIFGSGSEVAQRNVKAAETVIGIVQQATGAVNAQAAAEAVQSDPAARTAAATAIEQRWYEIAEAGGGGIEGARKAEAAAIDAGHRPWQSPSMWAMLLLAPMAYMIIGSVVGLWGTSDWSPDVRASIASAVVSLIIGGAAGYYWGATTSRNQGGAKV